METRVILQMEADEASRIVHRIALQDAGYRVVEPDDEEEDVLLLLARERPGLLLLDGGARDALGLRAVELCAHARSRGVPVLLLAPAVERPKVALPAEILPKPCMAPALLEAVARLTRPAHLRVREIAGEPAADGGVAWADERMRRTWRGLGRS